MRRTPTDLTTALAIGNAVRANYRPDVTDGRSKRFKEPVFTTWRGILKIAQRRLRSGSVECDDDGHYIFYFRNHEISTVAGVCERTVMRHRRVLKDAGMIAAYSFRGRQHPFALHIEGKYLGIVQELNQAEIEAEIARLCADPLLPFNPSNDILSVLPEEERTKQENTAVDKERSTQVPGDAPAEGAGNASQDMLGQQDAEERKHGCTATKRKRRAAAEIETQGVSKADAPGGGVDWAESRRQAIVARYTTRLWDYARNLLWAGAAINDRQVAGALWHIRNLYVKAYDNGQDLEHWHKIFASMVGMARKYLDRDESDSFAAQLQRAMGGIASGGGGTSAKKRFIVSPDMWFDPEFAGGFKGTYKWHLAKEAMREKVKGETALFAASKRWADNEKKPPSKRRPPISLWKELTDYLASFKDQQLIDRWMAIVIKPEGGQNG